MVTVIDEPTRKGWEIRSLRCLRVLRHLKVEWRLCREHEPDM